MLPAHISIAKKEALPLYKYRYAICTFVTDYVEYDNMLCSFIKAGFDTINCEYRYIDNTDGNNFDAYTGINIFLQNADAEFVLIVHQDILLDYDDIDSLEQRLAELNGIDKNWAVLGNAGTNNLYLTSMKVTQNDLVCYKSGVLPSKVQSLDENFLLIKKSANLSLPRDLSGFHLYGTELCMVAECLGYTAYTVEFNLLHLSHGKLNPSFYTLSKQFQNKYRVFFRGRYIKTTITSFYIGSNFIVNGLMNTSVIKFVSRLFYKIKYKRFKKY